MYPDQLYDLALAFRKAKLWKRLYDSELFAVSLSNGQTGYCCVMGMRSRQTSLAVYVGERGLGSYRLLWENCRSAANPLKAQEYMLSQSCLQCAFESKDMLNSREISSVRSYARTHGIVFRGTNAFPQFTKYQPARYPWPVLEPEDMEILCETLAAALAVNERLALEDKYRLGFMDGHDPGQSIPLLTPNGADFNWGLCHLPPQEPVSYPVPRLQDELLVMRLKKQKKRSGIWICDVVMFPQPMCSVEDGPDTASVFPYMLLAMEVDTELVIPSKLVLSYEDNAEELLHSVGQWMLDNRIPAEIHVVDDRTCALLEDLTSVLDIRLVRQPGSELLDDLEEYVLGFCDEQTPGMVEYAMDELSEMIMMLDDDVLLSMPGNLRRQLRAMERQGLFSGDVAKRIRNLF